MSHFNLRIAAKLPGMVVGLAILSSLAIGIVAYNKAASGLVDSADNMLSALNDARRNELGAYLQSIRQDVILLSGGGAVVSMEHEFETAFADLGANSTETLKKHYIKDNPNPAGEKHKLDDARDGSEWSKAHAHHHPWLRQLVDLRGYYDVFLVSSKGDVVYSVYKEEDFATNLVNGPWKGSNIAKLFRTVAANPKAGPQFADFEPYAPSNNVPAAFIGAPLFDKEGVFKGALIFQMPIGHINKVMQTATGMGESGETYIVGTDLLMRSDSRFAKESTILKTKVETETAKEALAGKTGVRGILDYRGTPVLSAYGPLEFLGAKWAVVAEIDEAEVRGPVTEMRNFMFMVGALLAAAVAALGVLAARSIIKPLAAMTEVMQRLSGGDKSVEIPATANTDEIGDMARAVLVFKENMIKAEQLETEARAQLEKDMERSKKRELLTADFDTMIRRVIERVNGSVQQVHVTSDAVHAAAEQTSRQSAAVSAAAEEASSNVQTVASAAEELGASTQEISRRVQDTTRITQEAVGGINEANTKMDSLANSANKIGEIINLINDIASQTNLLALNATIEAARAGDAGKGFAVVANEVKSLANQTAKATDEISQQIAEMQNSTQSALEATKKVAAVIGQANEVVSSIASAAEEQNAATQEIARNVAQASQGTSEVTVNISGVAQASVTTGEMAGKLFSVAEELEKVAQSVSKHVETFLASVKAA